MIKMTGFIKKIIAVTGTRADFGIYSSVFRNLQKHFELSLIVTGMHLVKDYGFTFKEVEESGYKIADKIDILFDSNSHSGMARSVAIGILGMTQTFERENPDLVMVLGDRGEMLAGAIAASFMNIPVAHIHGGELSGSIDDNVRHAITKLSHIHFVSNNESRKRLIKMGENPYFVHNVGAPSIDNIVSTKLLKKEELFAKYSIGISEPYFILIFHPTTTDFDSMNDQINSILSVISKFKTRIIAIKSNSDTGGKIINNTLEQYAEQNSFLNLYDNIPYMEYLSLLKYTSLLIGNSSSGIIESPTFKIPVINIGNRQKNRIRASNIIDVIFEPLLIENAINKALNDKKYRDTLAEIKNPYGTGKSGKEIVKILNKFDNKEILIQKCFYD